MKDLTRGALLVVLMAVSAAAQPPYPDPHRFAADIAAFATEDQIAPPPPGAVLCLGSSSMRFWHATMADDLQPLTLVLRGFGGSTLLDVLYYSDRLVVPYRPRAILLYEGDNDIEAGVSPARYLATLQQFIEVLHATLPTTRVYVMSIKPSPSRWHFWPQMEEANTLVRELCADDSRLTYLDVAAPMLGADQRPRPELFLADNLHLSPQGYAVWTAVVRAGLVTAEAPFE